MIDTENYVDNSNTLKDIKNTTETEDDLSKTEKPLNKDNPSDITLNINDFLEEQEESIKNTSTDTLKLNNTENKYEKERKLKYPLNDPNCPLYLRYMNILKHDYTNVNIFFN